MFLYILLLNWFRQILEALCRIRESELQREKKYIERKLKRFVKFCYVFPGNFCAYNTFSHFRELPESTTVALKKKLLTPSVAFSRTRLPSPTASSLLLLLLLRLPRPQ